VFDSDLIYDLGLHKGHDTRFYLDKGFRVIALDANPRFCTMARTMFAAEMQSRRCSIIEKALWKEPDTTVPFFTRDDLDGWSSLFIEIAERDKRKSKEITVSTTTLSSLLNDYGVPYYVKCDLEGGDTIFAEQLIAEKRLPPFVSVEFDSLDLPHLLRDAGYDRFQIINQAHLKLYRPPFPPREGRYVSIVFDGKMSGLFGRELPLERWVKFDRFVQQFNCFLQLPRMNRLKEYSLRRWGKLTRRGWLIKDSWLDLHATTERMLRA
jgi:FkbM family methyltransferase